MPRKPARIVILGGGLGGLYAALTLQNELAGFIQGEVQAFGLQARTIRTENLSIPYDYLIVALGSVPMLSLTTATDLTRATLLGQHSGMAEEGVQGALRPSHSRGHFIQAGKPADPAVLAGEQSDLRAPLHADGRLPCLHEKQ